MSMPTVQMKSIWKCPRANSPRFHRPVELIRASENETLIKRIIGQLHGLSGMFFRVDNVVVRVDIETSANDGKVRNTWFDELSSLCCAFCSASPSQFLEAFDWPTPEIGKFDMGISPMHLLVKAMEAMVRMGTKLNLPEKYHVYGHPRADGVEDDMRQNIKDKLLDISKLILIDRLQHNHIGNCGNVAREFFNTKLHKRIAKVLKVCPDFIYDVGRLARATNHGKRINTGAYRKVAKKIHDQWYKALPKVHMPVGLHILLKHVPDYQDIIDFGVGQTSEEGLEHLHKIIKDALRRHTNTSSLKSAHLSLMRYLLLASSPKLAAKYPQFQKLSHRKIDDDLAELLIINQ